MLSEEDIVFTVELTEEPFPEPKPLRIAVYAISRNEANFAKRCIEAALQPTNGEAGADCFILADTGSTDGTQQIALAAGATVHEITVNPWRFDTARNCALSLVPSDVDVFISVDLDEVLEPGFRVEVERLFRENPLATRLRYKYDWSHDVVFNSEKIHKRGYVWKYACHERLVSDPRTREVVETSDKLLIKHLPDETKDRSSYFRLMDVTYKENPNDKRTQLYYGRELQFNKKWQESIEVLNKYLTNTEYDWKEETAYCCTLISDAYRQLGNEQEARKFFLQGISEAPRLRKIWLALAAYMHDIKDWPECLRASKEAISIKDRALLYFDDGSTWGYAAFDYAALAAYNLGYFEDAYNYGMMAIQLESGDERLKANLKYYEERRSRR